MGFPTRWAAHTCCMRHVLCCGASTPLARLRNPRTRSAHHLHLNIHRGNSRKAGWSTPLHVSSICVASDGLPIPRDVEVPCVSCNCCRFQSVRRVCDFRN